jgi:hypothetical protein
MIIELNGLNNSVGKIPGIYHDTSAENQARAEEFLKFLQDHPEFEGSPQGLFVFSIFRDSIVSAYVNDGETNLIDIIKEKAPYLVDYPEQLDQLLSISTNDANETLKHRPW